MGFKPSKMMNAMQYQPAKCNVSFAEIYNAHPNATSIVITNDYDKIHKFIFLYADHNMMLYNADGGQYHGVGPVKNMTMPIFAKHIQVYIPNKTYAITYC